MSKNVFCCNCQWYRPAVMTIEHYGDEPALCKSPQRPIKKKASRYVYPDPVYGLLLSDNETEYAYIKCYDRNSDCHCDWFTHRSVVRRLSARIFNASPR